MSETSLVIQVPPSKGKYKIIPPDKWFCCGYSGSDRDPEWFETKPYDGRKLIYDKNILGEIKDGKFVPDFYRYVAPKKYHGKQTLPLDFIEYLKQNNIEIDNSFAIQLNSKKTSNDPEEFCVVY